MYNSCKIEHNRRNTTKLHTKDTTALQHIASVDAPVTAYKELLIWLSSCETTAKVSIVSRPQYIVQCPVFVVYFICLTTRPVAQAI
jgi:hypothetical protein